MLMLNVGNGYRSKDMNKCVVVVSLGDGVEG